MTEDVNYPELLTRLSTALVMTEAACVQTNRRRQLWGTLQSPCIRQELGSHEMLWERIRGRLTRRGVICRLPRFPRT